MSLRFFRRYCPPYGLPNLLFQSMPWAHTITSRNRLYCRAVITLIAIKNNQLILKELIENVFRNAPDVGNTTEEKGHGRQEKRTCFIMVTTLLEQEGMYEKWPSLKRVIRMERERTENGSRSRETVYYLSRVEKEVAYYYASSIRAHWSIENKMHWNLEGPSRRMHAECGRRMVPPIFQPCANTLWECPKSRMTN